MVNNDNDFELEGFSYGDGAEPDNTEELNGFVSDDVFGFDDIAEPVALEPSPPTPPTESQPQARVSQKTGGTTQTRQRPLRQSQVAGIDRNNTSDRMRLKARQSVNTLPPSHQRPPQQQRVNPQQAVLPNEIRPDVPQSNSTGRKKSKLKYLSVPVIIAISIVAFMFLIPKKLIPVDVDYSQTPKSGYDSLLLALNNYDATQIDSIVGANYGDSYLAQEWSYANNNEVRQNFIKLVCSHVNFTYPQVPQLSTTGKQITDTNGVPVTIPSTMSSGESVTVKYIDYNALSEKMKVDSANILDMCQEAGIHPEDYDYEEEMTDLMLTYINSLTEIPTTESELKLAIQSSGSSYIISDDISLDKLLFSSDAFHNMCDVFSQSATGFTGYETEKYTEQEEQLNPEYTEWKMKFDAYYEADEGRFKKGVSKWEPWYLRDDNNNYILDENGEKIVNYYSVKDDDGNDWIQPSETVLVDVEKERQVEVSWIQDSVVPYCFMGAYYCQNEYTGKFSSDVRVGDGTIEYPAGVGTPIITKCLGTDGKYHDVRVTMIGYWLGEDAINYAVSFSEKNRGFDINSVIQLICYEIKVENLEDEVFTFTSDMFLADKNSNKSARTGTMFGFTSEATVEGGQTVYLNDWATSTEIDQKYVCWGGSFNREYKVVYFKLLAGDGEIPSYSAYKAFTGEIDEDDSETKVNDGDELPVESEEPIISDVPSVSSGVE